MAQLKQSNDPEKKKTNSKHLGRRGSKDSSLPPKIAIGTYPPGNCSISAPRAVWKNHCPFPKVRYVSPLEGSLSKQGNRCIFDIFSHSDAHEPNIQHMQKLPLAHHKDVSLANVTSKLVGFSTGGGNCGTLRIPTKDWGTLGKIRWSTGPPLRIQWIYYTWIQYPWLIHGFMGMIYLPTWIYVEIYGRCR